MHLSTWLAFALASAAMGLTPGPGVTSIVGYALSSGRRTALGSVAGMALGNVLAMSVSLAGAGALYLIGRGVATIARSRRGLGAGAAPLAPISPRTAFLSNVAVGTFHPKTIVFFVAFAPQFIRPDVNYALQAAILIATFGIVVGATDTLYALAAARASHLLKSPRATLWSRRAGGGVLIAAGMATAAASRT
jgi:threonine/homoserine/homoserine lactone efflux protein